MWPWTPVIVKEETPVEKNLMLTCWHPPGETGAGSVNLHVVLKGNVAADHVKEQNPQRPDGEGDGLVALRCNPLGGAVDPSSWGRRKWDEESYNVKLGGTERDFVGGGWEEAMGAEWLGTLKLSVRRVLKHRPRPEVYDLDIHRSRVYHYVLVFDVQVHDVAGVNESKRFDHLMENPIGKKKEPGR